MPVDQSELMAYLADYLRLAAIPDDRRALNGLQVANSGKLTKLVVAVDACQATIDGCARADGDLLLVHHGLFWGGLEPLAGRHGRRVRALFESDIALFAAHVPLDCHPEVGNNAVLAHDLGIADCVPFGRYEGIQIGVAGRSGVPLAELERRLSDRLGTAPRVFAHGPARTERVGIVTGAASDLIHEARAAGIDTFITGEGPHHRFFDAEEGGMNLVFAGHYATETVGVQALARHLEERCGLPWEFIDHPTGM